MALLSWSALAETTTHTKHKSHHHHLTQTSKPAKKSAHHSKTQSASAAVGNHVPQDIQSDMNAILSKVSSRAHMGVIVETVNGGEILYQHNADNLFTPASVN